ncbi:nucleotidyltransferase domain-containing protein [Oscillatoria sp. CS-180]|uniref:nucleotidyltransferase domain-containing protein n=1 Tax=Oscillatoria sp. CS-180 TaxID=3021720 RepID=UPI00232BAF26|nr:nucleotidyltransferase domain-containing protein [Oscillatoria sp. CS-180]MDB9527468.1 nucleotidyltransferase domain-containing protein [Oscillatoria sp. CS-180]
MTSESKYPAVSQALLAEVVSRIRATGDPLKVVLFGSQARGDTHAESDLDLLVVEESDLPRFKRSPRYYKALMGVFPNKDITVWTPTEIQEWSAVPNAFITTALREGKVLYEKPA